MSANKITHQKSNVFNSIQFDQIRLDLKEKTDKKKQKKTAIQKKKKMQITTKNRGTNELIN